MKSSNLRPEASVMTPDLDFVRRKFHYHHWAADRAMDGVAKLSASQLDEPLGGSFKNGRALLRHVIGVERLWCERWTGATPRALPEFPASFSGADYHAEWKNVKAEQQKYLAGLSGEKVGGDLTWTNIKGEVTTAPLTEVFEHVVNHGTYHRGQITHLLRDRGMDVQGMDYLVFMKEFPRADSK